MDTTPRMRGLRRAMSTRCPTTADTTPRMRGLLLLLLPPAYRARYNPAYAGTTRPPAVQHQEAQIQPRVCGDYYYTTSEQLNNYDTTPRMRGLRMTAEQQREVKRYNPAYAGTTE